MLKHRFHGTMLFQTDEGGAAGGTGDGHSAGQNAGQQQGQAQQQQGQQSQQGQQGQQGQQQEQPKFTQADLDRLLGERAKRAEETTQKQILEALGVKSLDELKAIKEAADKAREAQMTELEKAQKTAQEAQAAIEKTAQEAKEKVEKAEAERTAALAQANEMLMRSAVLAEATKADYRIRPEAMGDVWSFVKGDKALLDKIKPAEGKPGEFTGLADALKELLKAKTYMVDNGTVQGTPRDGSHRRPASTPEEPTKEELARASQRATHDKF